VKITIKDTLAHEKIQKKIDTPNARRKSMYKHRLHTYQQNRLTNVGNETRSG
jgi:hypothetical protein